MPIDLDDYKIWAENEKNNRREPSLHQYLRHLVYEEANAESKRSNNEQNMIKIGRIK